MIRAIALFCLLLLGSCATLSEDECRAGDWGAIGFEDGAAGRDASFIGRHREACATFGVAPDLNAWLAGRQSGLRQYCTPANAYAIGQRGGSVNPVCPVAAAQAMGPAFQQGQLWYTLGLEISDIDREIDDARAALADLDPAKENADVLERSLRTAILRAEDERNRLEAERRIAASWP